MAYLYETEILNDKPLFFSLCSIYGLGSKTSQLICRKLGYSDNLTFSSLTDEQISRLLLFLTNSGIILNNERKKKQSFLFQQKLRIKLRRGLRLMKGLPVRGQRTHTNAKTVKRFKKFS